MAANGVGDESGTATEVAPGTLRAEDVADILQQVVAPHLAALREDRDALHRELDAIRSALQTAVLGDVMELLARSEAPPDSELQRRAQAIQLELTVRRQAVALDEWRR